MARTLAWILPLQAAIFLAFGLYRGLWRFASIARPAAHRARRGARRAADPARARDAAAAGGRAAQRADLLPDRAHLPDGGQPLRLPDLEGAPPLQPARGARRAGAGRSAPARRARASRAELARSRQWRVVGLLDDDPAKQGRLLRNVSVLGPIVEPARVGEEVRRAQGDHRAAVGRARRAPARRRDLRRRRRRGADRAVVRGPDQRPLGAHHDPQRSSSTTCSGRDPVVLDSAGLAEWLGNRVVHGHRRRRLDRRRALRGRSRASARRGSCCSTSRRRRSTRSRRRSPTRSRSCRWRRSSATSSTRRWSTRCSRASGRASSSTPARTSTCR